MMKSLAPAAIASAKPRGNHQFSPAWIGVGDVSRTSAWPEQVFLRHRLLDPVQIIGREPLDAARGFGGIERLVEVDHQRDVGAEQGAHALDHALVIGGIAVAALDLDAAKALIQRAAQVLLVGDGIDHAITVIGLDRPRRSAEQFGQRPDPRIWPSASQNAMSRPDTAMPTRPCQPSRRNFASIAAIRSNGATGLPVEFAADLLDQMHQRLQRQLGVGEDVGAAGNALIGRDIDQHQRRGLDDAEGVFHRPRDRRDDGRGP